MTLAPGAHVEEAGTRFVVLATSAARVSVRLGAAGERTVPLEACASGWFEARVPGVGPGTLYSFDLDGAIVGDPYARFLPFGVDGPACVVAPRVEPALAPPLPLDRWVIYELHVGAFSREGTYAGVEARLDELARLGVTALELMPIAAFPGERGWGYDGVALYAPHAPYGEPGDLRRLVHSAHARGLAIVLDVVYNHIGPSGCALPGHAREYIAGGATTPWGPAPEFSYAPMRRLVVDNARYWLEEFGVDALRIDATQAMRGEAGRRVLTAITALAHALTPKRLVFFEDDRNDPRVVTELGADAVWTDDFQKQVRVLSTGTREGTCRAYAPSVEALARTVQQGWLYTGQPYAPWGDEPRGAPTSGLRPAQLVYAVQNHDEIGGTASGARLSEEAGEGAFAAVTTLLLFLPTTPLLFMGQEWGATSPFPFFRDAISELGSPARAPETFLRAKLVWDERTRAPQERLLSLHREMLSLRRRDPVLSSTPSRFADLEAHARGDVLEVVRKSRGSERRALVSFADEPRRVDTRGARVLFSTAPFDGATLAARAALILARD